MQFISYLYLFTDKIKLGYLLSHSYKQKLAIFFHHMCRWNNVGYALLIIYMSLPTWGMP